MKTVSLTQYLVAQQRRHGSLVAALGRISQPRVIDRASGHRRIQEQDARKGQCGQSHGYTARRFSLPVLSPSAFTFTPSVSSMVR